MTFKEELIKKKRAETREDFYEKVEFKVQTILNLRQLVDKLNGLDSEEIKSKLDGVVFALSLFPSFRQNRMDRGKILIKLN